jgi:hypothetical protein
LVSLEPFGPDGARFQLNRVQLKQTFIIIDNNLIFIVKEIFMKMILIFLMKFVVFITKKPKTLFVMNVQKP